MTLKIAVYGAAGKMGRGLLSEILKSNDLEIALALDRPESPLLGRALVEGAPPLCADLSALAAVDLVIDFSVAAGVSPLLEALNTNPRPLVTGTTGLSEDQLDGLSKLSQSVAVLHAPNMSVGVNLLLKLVAQAAAALPDWDAEILELHHRFKRDAPSGTAMALLCALADAREQDPSEVGRLHRHGEAPRNKEEITVQTLRGGDVTGEHTAYFLGFGERLEITHRATDRGIFVKGALRAARWLQHQPPGRYTMQDVLA